MRNEIGKYLLDVSKLVLGGVVLSTIFEIEDMSKWVILLVGFIITIFFAIIGFLLIKNE